MLPRRESIVRTSFAGILAGSPIRRLEEQWLDPRVVVVDLANAAEQIHVRGDDIIRGRQAMNDPNAADLVARRQAVVQRRFGARCLRHRVLGTCACRGIAGRQDAQRSDE